MANVSGSRPRIGRGKDPKDLKAQGAAGAMVKASIFMRPELNRRLKMMADREQQETRRRVSVSTLIVRLVQAALKMSENNA